MEKGGSEGRARRYPWDEFVGKYDARVKSFVDATWATQFRCPTIREVMREVGISSTSVARNAMSRVGDREGHGQIGSRYAPRWVQVAIQDAWQQIQEDESVEA